MGCFPFERVFSRQNFQMRTALVCSDDKCEKKNGKTAQK